MSGETQFCKPGSKIHQLPNFEPKVSELIVPPLTKKKYRQNVWFGMEYGQKKWHLALPILTDRELAVIGEYGV